MKAVCWMGKSKLETLKVPDPQILNPRDAIIRVTRTAICGSDLHLFDGFIPTMESGDILGHEFMGIVEEVGPAVTNLRRGDRVVVPFTIACGNCQFCAKKIWAACDNSNPNAHLMEAAYGYSGSGLFGYSHMMGGYAGGQAQYVRVPFANVGPLKIESDLADEKVLFLSDIFPTGYMAAENAQIQDGDTVAVWGCGPVGQFAIASAFMLGAGQVIAIDSVPERLAMARTVGAVTVQRSDWGDRTRWLYRCSWPRISLFRPAACLRLSQGCLIHGDGPAQRLAAGYPGGAQGWNGFDSGCLRRHA
jgi:threonine dehydrogenase-like Zn-dependent dehydrogenase